MLLWSSILRVERYRMGMWKNGSSRILSQFRERLQCATNSKIKCIMLLLLVTLLLDITLTLTQTYRSSWLLSILNHVAVTKPSSCDPHSNFQPNVTPAQPYDGRELPWQALGLPQNKDGYLIPNIVHYIWFAEPGKQIKIYQMLSILSVHKYIKPEVIYFHTNNEPEGKYWNRVKHLLKIVPRNPTTCVYNEPITNPIYETSASNVDRLTVLLERGGIYLDLDVLVVQSFDPLRKYPCVIGREDDLKVNGGIIVCNKNSAYLRLWLQHYLLDYRVWWWAYNSGWVPTWLAQRHPDLIHVDQNMLQKPGFKRMNRIWGEGTFNWRDSYAVHLLPRMWRSWYWFYGVGYREPDEAYIQQANNTFAQMARRILDGKNT